MASPGNFKTYKLRGEWVELLFMTRAAELGFNVSKPFGDSARYDVSVESGGQFKRVQVKSTSVARGEEGFICYLKRTGIQYYRLSEVDFFAIYVIPEKVWYILPAKVVLRLSSNIRLAPRNPKQKYYRYKEAWWLLRGRRRGCGVGAARLNGGGSAFRRDAYGRRVTCASVVPASLPPTLTHRTR